MLNVYKVMSENISSAIATNGETVTKQPLIRSMRTVKKETLKLISGWVSRSTDPQMVRTFTYQVQALIGLNVGISVLFCLIHYTWKQNAQVEEMNKAMKT